MQSFSPENHLILFTSMVQVHRCKSALTFEKWPLVAELKVKMSEFYETPFFISALPPVGTGAIQLWLHFLHLQTFIQKRAFRLLICCVLTECIASTLNLKVLYIIARIPGHSLTHKDELAWNHVTDWVSWMDTCTGLF